MLRFCYIVCVLSMGSALMYGCEESPRPIPERPLPFSLDDIAPSTTYAGTDRGQETIRRLTRDQFVHAVRDLLGDDIVVPGVAEPDVARSGLRSIGASAVTYSPRGVESLESAAYDVSAQALADEAKRGRLVGCTPTGTVDEDCAARSLSRLAAKGWRRPVSDDEVGRLVQVSTAAAEVLDDFYEGLQYGIAAIIQSPHFLFRIEVGQLEDGVSQRQLTAHELAARLSFFIWNTPPDSTLREAAENGSILTRQGLFAQATRLLDDQRARSGLRSLFDDYLQLYELDHLRKDPTVFEHFNDQLGAAAREETLQVIEDLAFDNPRDFRELMTTRKTFINPMLASIYRVPAPAMEGFALAELPEDENRAGILGHVSFLATHAHSRASSATRRGVAVRTILLCESIPAPPVDVDTSIPEPSSEVQTLRERVAEHLENPSCAGCHLLTDPIGLGLENFDGIGRYRETEYGDRIDPSGTLDGQDFLDPIELGVVIKDHVSFVPCIVKMLSRYATGRLEDGDEYQWLTVLNERFAFHDYELKPLIMELVMSPLFRRVGTLKEAQ